MKTALRNSFHSMSLKVVDPQRGYLTLKVGYNGFGLTMGGFKQGQNASAKAIVAKADSIFNKALGKVVKFPKGIKNYGEFMTHLEAIGKSSKGIPEYLARVNKWLGGS